VVNERFVFVVARFGEDRALVGSNGCADAGKARNTRSVTLGTETTNHLIDEKELNDW
jgi:hypothetical protein